MLKLLPGQQSLTVISEIVTAKKLRQTVIMTATT